MMLTKYADYSIRVLMYLADRPGEKVPITVIADTYGISRNHLMKVSQNLARNGYIVGYRGKGGGISLARPARSINIGQVLGKVESNLKPINRRDYPGIHDGDKRFVEILEEARKACLAAFADYTLADLVSGKNSGPAPRANGTHQC